MKILHVIPKQKMGGVETAVFSAYENINRNYCDFNIVIIEKNENNIKNTSDGYLRLNSNIINPMGFIKFLRVIYRQDPDIIVCSLWKSVLLGLLAKLVFSFFKKKPRFVMIRHNTQYAHLVDKLINKLGYNYFDEIFFDSCVTKEKCIQQDKIKNDGAIISFLTKKLNPRKYSFNRGDFRFVFIGRLHPVKNIIGSLKFIHFLKDFNANISFDIYGPDEGELKSINDYIKVHKLENNVKYCGVIENKEIESVLSKYNFFIQMSRQEGMAMSVVEALQVGVIPCVTNVGEISSYCIDGTNSFLFDSKRIDNEKYLYERAKHFVNVMTETKVKSMYDASIATFNDVEIYCDDFIKKIAKLKAL